MAGILPNGTNGKNGTAFWKQLASVLLATLITGVGTWLVFGRDVVTRQEMNEAIFRAIPKDSGYSEDRKLIQDKLSALERLSSDLAVIRDSVRELTVQMKLLTEQQQKQAHR